MLSDPCRTPGFLRIAPVDPGQQIDNCAGEIATAPPSIFGQINRPFSSRRVKRQALRSSCQMIFKISDLRPLKTKRCPDNGSCFRTSCTRSAREGKPQRMSVYPVESQTLTPVPIGNGFTAAPPVRAGSEAALQRRHRVPRSHGDHWR